MSKKYVSVRFTKNESSDITAQVESDLSGAELEERVRVPNEWMEEYFGDGWENWEVDEVTEITEDWSLLKHRQADASFDR